MGLLLKAFDRLWAALERAGILDFWHYPVRAFLTGSRVYGTPREDSDLDLVVFVDEDTKKALRAMSDSNTKLMYGGLNLIAVTTKAEYDAWYKGTDILKNRPDPVKKAEACEVFDALLPKKEWRPGY